MNKKIGLMLALACLFVFPTGVVFAEVTKKPEAAVAPVSVIGNVSAGLKSILLNRLRSKLSDAYRLVSQQEFIEAQNMAFQDLEDKNCTEDHCIRKIQEILQVERLYVLQIIKEKALVQLSLSLITLNDKQVKDDVCRNCGEMDLYKRVDGLANPLIAKDTGRARKDKDPGSVAFVTAMTETTTPKGGVTRITPDISGDTTSDVSALIIDSEPSGADLYLGDIRAGRTPYQNLQLKAGQTLRITLKKTDYRDKTLELKLSGGVNNLDTIKLKPVFGSLEITSEPAGADVYIANEKVGRTPYKNQKLASGAYLVSIRKPLYANIENKRITVKDEAVTKQHFTLPANFGTLKVKSVPKGARVVVTDTSGREAARKKTPANFRLDPGKYGILIEQKKYAPLKFEVTIARNKVYAIGENAARLKKLEGRVIVSTEPLVYGASVHVDGEYQGKIPATLTIEPGTHEITVKGNGKFGKEKIRIHHGKTHTVKVQMKEKKSFFSKYKWWILGAVAVGGGAAAAMGGGSNGGGDSGAISATGSGSAQITWE